MRRNLPILLICGMAVILIIFIYFDSKYCDSKDGKYNNIKEGFATSKMSVCPDFIEYDTYGYHDGKIATTLCCNKALEGGKCTGTPVCTLGNGTDNIKGCTDVTTELYNTMAKDMCPSTLPNLYFNRSKMSLGCTDGAVNANFKAPLSKTSKICQYYFKKGAKDFKSDNYDNDANATNADACKLMGDLESMSKECIGPDCQPFSRYNSTSKTNLIGMDFTDSAGDRHTCYSNDSYTNFLKKIRPGTNMQSNNINLCDIAKKVYIDKTLQVSSPAPIPEKAPEPCPICPIPCPAPVIVQAPPT